MDIIRVIRIIVYEGERGWVERTINNSITGSKTIDPGRSYNKIHVATIGGFPEVLGELKNDDRPVEELKE